MWSNHHCFKKSPFISFLTSLSSLLQCGGEPWKSRRLLEQPLCPWNQGVQQIHFPPWALHRGPGAAEGLTAETFGQEEAQARPEALEGGSSFTQTSKTQLIQKEAIWWHYIWKHKLPPTVWGNTSSQLLLLFDCILGLIWSFTISNRCTFQFCKSEANWFHEGRTWSQVLCFTI